MRYRLYRREVLKFMGATPLIPAFALSGCSNGSNGGRRNSDLPQEMVPWASGGTELITVDFPGDEIFESGNTCELSLLDQLIEGPCYFENASGEDISEGEIGLPMQVCLQVIDSDCVPVNDYVVELWHSDNRGVYSADTSESADSARFRNFFCSEGDAAAQESNWFRGTLRTDASGRVNFKTCFPGWYAGRTIHFHISIADSFGNNRFLSQLCFTDELAEEICTTHEHYIARGIQDTTLASGTDIEFGSDGYEQFVMSTRQNVDGTMLAYHRIQIV